MNGLDAFALLVGGGWFALTAAAVAVGLFNLRHARSSGRADERFLWWVVGVRSLTALIGVTGGVAGGAMCFLGLDGLFDLALADVPGEDVAYWLGAAMALWALGAAGMYAALRNIPTSEAEEEADVL